MNAPEWFQNEEFWSATYPFMFSEARFDLAPQEVAQILALMSGRPVKRVLDLACGPGRHSVELAKLGYRVTGVDRSEFLLDKARSRGEAAGVEVEWVTSDMRDFVRPEAFDLALILFTSFGFFETDEENRKVLENLNASLVPGGSLVFDVSGKEILARNFVEASARDVLEGVLVVKRRQVVENWSKLASEWLLVADGDVRSFRFRHWIYSAREVELMLRSAGFREVDVYGDLSGHPYGLDANRLIAVARK